MQNQVLHNSWSTQHMAKEDTSLIVRQACSNRRLLCKKVLSPGQEPRPELTMKTIINVYFITDYGLLVNPHNIPGICQGFQSINGRDAEDDLSPGVSVTQEPISRLIYLQTLLVPLPCSRELLWLQSHLHWLIWVVK